MTTATVSKVNSIEPSFGNALAHYLPITVFPLMFAAAWFGGWWLIAPFVFFVAAGPLDLAFGLDERNMDPKTTSESRLFAYNIPVWLWALLWPSVFVFTLWQIFIVGQHELWESIVLALMLAIEGQAIFIVGHELIHRRVAWERYIGEFLLASGSYPHYATEHFYIHHNYVGTPLDVGSAPKGQSFWNYFPRELYHNLTGAWKMARWRMARRRLPFWHYSNPFWRYGIETAAWYAFVYVMGGWIAVLIFMLLCLGIVFSMKISNYIQHYGLRRIRLPNGRFERVRPRHSWSANYKFSKWMFFNFQRHADHHVTPSRHYPLLQHYGADVSPQLPASYGTLFNLALRPKRWFETIDPLVDQWREQFYPEVRSWKAYDSQVSVERPEAFDVIVELFESASRLARAVEQSPELLDSLQEREFTDLAIPGGFGPDPEAEAVARRGLVRVYWTFELGVAEMKERLMEIPAQDSEDTAEIVRHWANGKTFQVAMHTLRGNLSPIEAGIALANIAEAALFAVLLASVEDEEDRFYQSSDRAMAVIALGDLASREFAPDHLIELLLVHEGFKYESHESLCRRFHEVLEILTRDSILFKSLVGNRKYISEFEFSSLQDDLQSDYSAIGLANLTRARCIFTTGNPEIEEKFVQAQRDALKNAAARDRIVDPFEDDSESADDLSLGEAAAWGVPRIESAARWLQVNHLPDLIDSNTASNAVSVFEEAGEGTIISQETQAQLTEAAQLWRNLAGIHRLILDSDGEDLTESAQSVVAQACGHSDFSELTAAVRDASAITANGRKAVFENSS